MTFIQRDNFKRERMHILSLVVANQKVVFTFPSLFFITSFLLHSFTFLFFLFTSNLHSSLHFHLISFLLLHFSTGNPRDLIIFFVGGATYEEVINAVKYATSPEPPFPQGVRIIVGGTCFHNSRSYAILDIFFS